MSADTRPPEVRMVTHADAAALMLLGRLPLGAGSPLADFLADGLEPDSVMPETVQRLAADGWIASQSPPTLHADCLDAFTVLRAPAVQLTLTLGSAQGLVTLDAYCDVDPPTRWVRFEPDAARQSAHLEFFTSTSTLVDAATRTLALGGGLLAPPFRGQWTISQYVVLLGLVDIFRTACLRAILDRTAPGEIEVTPETIVAAIARGQARPHYYWAASLGSLMSPEQMGLSTAVVEDVLEELARLQHLGRSPGGACQWGQALREFAVSLLLVPSFVILSMADWQRTGAPARLALVRGANSLWLFDFVGDTVAIEPLEGESVADRLRKAIETKRPVPAVSVTASPAQGASRDTDHPPPSAGGRTVPREAIACPHCHAPLRKSVRFCTRCGKEQPAFSSPASVLCGRCGRMTRAGRFCTLCGTSLQLGTGAAY